MIAVKQIHRYSLITGLDNFCLEHNIIFSFFKKSSKIYLREKKEYNKLSTKIYIFIIYK